MLTANEFLLSLYLLVLWASLMGNAVAANYCRLSAVACCCCCFVWHQTTEILGSIFSSFPSSLLKFSY